MTQSFGHLHCENFNAPLEEYTPMKPEEYVFDGYNWRNFPHFDQMSKDLAKIHVRMYVDLKLMYYVNIRIEQYSTLCMYVISKYICMYTHTLCLSR